MCPLVAHRQQVKNWVSEKEQRESSNVEEEALNADIFPEEGQAVKEAARADSGEEDEGRTKLTGTEGIL